MKMKMYPCLLYRNAPMALDIFPRFLQTEKTHNSDRCITKPTTESRLFMMQGYLRRVIERATKKERVLRLG